MSYPREKRGVENLTFFSLVWDTPLDSEMSGDFLIYVEKMEEVKRIFLAFFQLFVHQKECKDFNMKNCQFLSRSFLIKMNLKCTPQHPQHPHPHLSRA